MTTIYKIKTDAGVMYISANLVDASAPIHTYFGSEPFYDRNGESEDSDGLRWDSTPYQTADARHDDDHMAKLVADYCDMGNVISCEIVGS